MATESILARVRSLGTDSQRATSSQAVRDDILNQLRAMFLTRRGSMLTCPGYGILDMGEMLRSYREGNPEIEKEMKQTIQHYEPRLANVRVRLVKSDPSTLTLHYEITAELQSDHGIESIQIQTSIDASRQVTIR